MYNNITAGYRDKSTYCKDFKQLQRLELWLGLSHVSMLQLLNETQMPQGVLCHIKSNTIIKVNQPFSQSTLHAISYKMARIRATLMDRNSYQKNRMMQVIWSMPGERRRFILHTQSSYMLQIVVLCSANRLFRAYVKITLLCQLEAKRSKPLFPQAKQLPKISSCYDLMDLT